MKIVLFEQPLPEGWVYPCTLADIERQLQTLPPADLEGLWSVGLAAATHKDCQANGRYNFGERPTIRLYSHRDDYTFKLPPHIKPVDIEMGLAVEQQYGMAVERVGSRYLCRWEAASLREFIVGHVLLHEVGHHVYAWGRSRQGLQLWPSSRVSEQFAEAYALRHARQFQSAV